jgi:hypothetical protein
MSLIETASPFLSPVTKYYRGYCTNGNGFPIIPRRTSRRQADDDTRAGEESTKATNHNETPFESQGSVPSQHTLRTLSTTDDLLLLYIRTRDRKLHLSHFDNKYFPIYSKLTKDDYYKCYLRARTDEQNSVVDDDQHPASHRELQRPLHSPGLRHLKYEQQRLVPQEQHQRDMCHGRKRSPLQARVDLSPEEPADGPASPRVLWKQYSPQTGLLAPPISIKKSDDEPVSRTIVLANTVKLPENFVDCPLDHLISLISRMLRSLILLNDNSVPKSISRPQSDESGSPTKSSLLTRYHSRTPPSISIPTYLSRLTKFNNFTTATLLTTIYYIDLLSHHYQPFFTLNSWTVHRFLLVGTMLSQKLMEDFFYTNDHYAKVGGVAISELNCLELDFLSRVDWKCIPAKQLDNGKSSIRYAKDVLDLYYMQLIQLMGANTAEDDEVFFEANEQPAPSEGSQFHSTNDASHADVSDKDEDEQDGSDFDMENYDSNEESDYESPPRVFSPSHGKRKATDSPETSSTMKSTVSFNVFGYSVDGSSSPHLKRRLSGQSEELC